VKNEAVTKTMAELNSGVDAGTITQWHAGDYVFHATLTPEWPRIEKTIRITRSSAVIEGRIRPCVQAWLDLDGQSYAMKAEINEDNEDDGAAFELAKHNAVMALRVDYAARVAGHD
jgi:hypothetical protein